MVKLIVAISENRVIGKDNDLIWHLPADMKFFSGMTKGNVVIMGRKNWESIPAKYRPLPERINVVLSRDNSFEDEGCEVFTDISNAIDTYQSDDRDVYVIGGGQIYQLALAQDLIDEMYVTEIEQTFDGDTYFPEIDPTIWSKERLFTHKKDEANPHTFSVFRYFKA
jgi:dihydrofolate reductase